MEELGPEEIEGLLEELEGESRAEEALSPEVAQLLRDLDPARPMKPKVEAVRQLGRLCTSSPQIVKALADASMWDANAQFRRLAAAALLAPAHQVVIEQHPELLPRYVTNLLREIQEAGAEVAEPDLQEVADSRQEASTSRVEDILHALERASSVRARARAAERLGRVEESGLEIVEALIAARDNDPFYAVRKAAAEALRAPVHEVVLREDAGLRERARQEAAPRDWGAELLAAPVKPERVQVEDKEGTLSLSWKEGRLHKVLSAGLTVLLVLLLAYALFAGTYSGDAVGIVVVALLLPGYWALVAFVNSTQIKLGRGEWIFQRGPFPFPNRRFYSGRARIDPAAYIEIRTVQVAEQRRGAYGGGSSSEIAGVIAEVLVGALLQQSMGPRITYSLYARAKDGSDKLLLDRLEGHEADYLKHTLQDMLDTEYLGSMQEEPGEHMDGEASPARVEAEPAPATGSTEPEPSPKRTSIARRPHLIAMLVSILASLPVVACASSLWILAGLADGDQVIYNFGDSLYKLGAPLTMIVLSFPDYAGRYLTTEDDLWAIPLVCLLFIVQWLIWGQLLVLIIRGLRARRDRTLDLG